MLCVVKKVIIMIAEKYTEYLMVLKYTLSVYNLLF